MIDCLFVGPVSPPYGGMATYLAGVMHSLEARGVRCQVARFPQGVEHPGLKGACARVVSYLRLFQKLAMTSAPVVVLCSGSRLNLLAQTFLAVFATALGRHVIVRLGTGDFVDYLGNCRGLVRFWLRRVFARVSACIAVNGAIAAALPEYLPADRILLLSNALPVEPGDPTPSILSPEVFEAASFLDEGSPRLVLVGGIQPVYGVAFALDALKGFKSDYPEFRLILVIKDSYSSENATAIADQIRKSGLDESVRQLWAITLGEVALLLEHAEVLLRPSLWDGDSNVVREALGRGLGVLASDVCSRPAGVVLYRVGSRDSFLKSVAQLVEAPRLNDTSAFVSMKANLAAEGEANARRIAELVRSLARKSDGATAEFGQPGSGSKGTRRS